MFGHFFLLIYHQLAFSSNRLQVTQNKKNQTPMHNLLYKSELKCLKWQSSLTRFAQSCCCEYKLSKNHLTVVIQTQELLFYSQWNCRSTDTRTTIPQTLELPFHRHQNCRSTDTRTAIPQTLEPSFYSQWNCRNPDTRTNVLRLLVSAGRQTLRCKVNKSVCLLFNTRLSYRIVSE